jgi:heme exporter protein D
MMSSFLNWLDMGGYGVYLWPAYGLVFGLLALQLFFPWRRCKKIKKKTTHVQT